MNEDLFVPKHKSQAQPGAGHLNSSTALTKKKAGA